MHEQEQYTIKAISRLVKEEMPFAAAALCYVLIERCLKLHLLKNRKTLGSTEIDIDAKVGDKKDLRFRDFATRPDSEFVESYLNNIPLGGLEIVYRIQSRNVRDARNRLLHSGFYLSDQREAPFAERQAQNWAHYETAAHHLEYCGRSCIGEAIEYDTATKELRFTS